MLFINNTIINNIQMNKKCFKCTIKYIILLIFVIILGLVLYSLIKNNHIENMEGSNANIITGDLNIGSIEQEQMIISAMSETLTTPFSELSELQHNTVQSTTTEKIEPIKTIYKEFDQVINPSSKSLETGGYISRDYVCYREKAGDINFISKRPMCMVCTLNNNNEINQITKTNIESTCVYASDNEVSNIDNNVWTKDRCIKSCKLLQEEKNI